MASPSKWLLVSALVLVGAVWLLVASAAGRPTAVSRAAACNPGSALPGKAALRLCAGLNLPTETLDVEDSSSGVVTLHSPFIGTDIKKPTLCGTSGCIYHHWNWGGEFLEEIVVSGCAANDETCKVDLNHSGFGAKWAIVTVSLDDNNQGNEVAFAVTGQSEPCRATSSARMGARRSESSAGGILFIGDGGSGCPKHSLALRLTGTGGNADTVQLVAWTFPYKCVGGGQTRTANGSPQDAGVINSAKGTFFIGMQTLNFFNAHIAGTVKLEKGQITTLRVNTAEIHFDRRPAGCPATVTLDGPIVLRKS